MSERTAPEEEDSRDTLFATFARQEDAEDALEALLAAGFLNVEREREGPATLLGLDAGARVEEARAVFRTYHGVEIARPT